jgi:hypothetical protein
MPSSSFRPGSSGLPAGLPSRSATVDAPTAAITDGGLGTGGQTWKAAGSKKA